MATVMYNRHYYTNIIMSKIAEHIDHIVRNWKRACDEVCRARTIQRCFMRTLRRNTEGDIDESLVPKSIRDWYEGTDDEQDTDSENESDCEWS